MSKSGQLWCGRFTGKPDETFAEFNKSFDYDRRLFRADVHASIAHANGLLGAGVLTGPEIETINKNLFPAASVNSTPDCLNAASLNSLFSIRVPAISMVKS